MPATPKPVARFRLRISLGELTAIGPGKVALLEAIRDHGSLTAAARALGISYRRAWTMLDEINGALRYPAVASAAGGTQGGGSLLTPVGEEVVARYRRIEADAAAACQDDLRALQGLLQAQRS
ncbi:winged helix-turn-helix domain-containing protein [Ideonella sp. BN130291]|uniref:winged helix-turn-helix domain-containing protein n=1 Tax=Ideonella sp. BN130291 TaxID=3112940 RepID=UPI002E26D846|nr:ModE family transcriptional regulator [Ideonella sp. BN130291]